MLELLVIPSAFVVIIGVGVFVWSILDTRKKYYREYLEQRNRNDRD